MFKLIYISLFKEYVTVLFDFLNFTKYDKHNTFIRDNCD